MIMFNLRWLQQKDVVKFEYKVCMLNLIFTFIVHQKCV